MGSVAGLRGGSFGGGFGGSVNRGSRSAVGACLVVWWVGQPTYLIISGIFGRIWSSASVRDFPSSTSRPATRTTVNIDKRCESMVRRFGKIEGRARAARGPGGGVPVGGFTDGHRISKMEMRGIHLDGSGMHVSRYSVRRNE